MRQIKFRGLSLVPLVKENDWLYGNLYINYDDKLAYIDEQPVRFDSIGQYTGWKDRNNKEVFEGDYISFTDLIGDDLDGEKEELFTVGRVVWNERDAQFSVSILSKETGEWDILDNLYTFDWIEFHLGGFDIIDYAPGDHGLMEEEF